MLEKAEREKDDLRASNAQHKLCINYLEASTSSLKKLLSIVVTELFLKTKPRVSSFN